MAVSWGPSVFRGVGDPGRLSCALGRSGLGGSGRLRADELLVLVLVAPDLLAREAKLAGDLELRDLLLARFQDGAAERKARLRDLLAGGLVCVSRSNDGSHRISHLRIVTPVWPLPSMRHKSRPRH